MGFIISGVKKTPRILIGRAGIKLPIFERLDRIYLGQISVEYPKISGQNRMLPVRYIFHRFSGIVQKTKPVIHI